MKFEKLKGDHTSDKYWWFDFFPESRWRLHWMKINVLFLFCFQPSLVRLRLSKRMLHEIYVLDFNFNIYLVFEGHVESFFACELSHQLDNSFLLGMYHRVLHLFYIT